MQNQTVLTTLNIFRIFLKFQWKPLYSAWRERESKQKYKNTELTETVNFAEIQHFLFTHRAASEVARPFRHQHEVAVPDIL